MSSWIPPTLIVLLACGCTASIGDLSGGAPAFKDGPGAGSPNEAADKNASEHDVNGIIAKAQRGEMSAEEIASLFETFSKSIEANCVGCHGADGSPFPATDFAILTTQDAWINHPARLIVPGKPLESPVYYRTLHAKGKVPSSINTNMPFVSGDYGSNELSDADGQAIFDFIGSLASPIDESAEEPPRFAEIVVPPVMSLAKAKYLTDGAAPTEDEIDRVTAENGQLNRAELRAMITDWLSTPAGREKLQDFFELSLDQTDWSYMANPITGPDPGRFRADWELYADNAKASFARTVMDIVNNGRPFTEIMTTNRHAVTTALLSGYLYADGSGRQRNLRGQTTNNEFLLVISRECERRNGQPLGNGDPCLSLARPNGAQTSDFSDWRFVNFLQNNNNRIVFDDWNALRNVGEGGSINLRLPRTGFYNTLAFQYKNQTNVDNDFRVTASQTLIVALNRIFEAGDPTPEGSLAALDEAHAGPGTSCFSCHRLLDPIREVFRTAYNTDYLAGSGQANQPAFAFAGFTGPSGNLNQFADTIIRHPSFALGWVSKVCAYANAKPCDANSPVLTEIAERFRRSNHDFIAMAADVLSSPVVTQEGGGLLNASGPVLESEQGLISASRRNHLCQAMNRRYRQVLNAKGRQYNLPNADVCNLNAQIRNAVAAIPIDASSRGAAEFIQASSHDSFTVMASERTCRYLSNAFVSNQNNRGFDCCGEDRITESVANMTKYIVGLPENHPRHEATKDFLMGFYGNLNGSDMSNSALDALRETFVFACTLPEVMGVGL